jgi:hypothetical protein
VWATCIHVHTFGSKHVITEEFLCHFLKGKNFRASSGEIGLAELLRKKGEGIGLVELLKKKGRGIGLAELLDEPSSWRLLFFPFIKMKS